jgi:tetratricopeptide (TPR) repeat protein
MHGLEAQLSFRGNCSQGLPMSEGDSPSNPPRIFISYAQYDPAHAARVLELAYALEADGLAVELDQFHGQELIDWPRWCAERLDPENTDFVLMVCSAEYRRRIEGKVDVDSGRGVFWEGNLIYGYLYRAKANERFVPVLFDDAPRSCLPPVVANWNSFPLRRFGLETGDQGYEDLYRLLTGQPATPRPVRGSPKKLPPRALPSPGPAASAVKPINLPYPSLGSLFKGRDELLATLHAGFAGVPGQAQVIVARHAIHGLGGIGKTRAAVEYAWRHAADYRALLFVTAHSPQDLHTQLAALCELLHLAPGVTEEAERMRAAFGWLADPAQAGWLLIVDNVDTREAAQAVARTLAPLGSGHLLITSRLSEWPPEIAERRVDVLDVEAARAFLLERTAGKRRSQDDDGEQALNLARELGGLALALEQAAAFIRSRALSLAEYRCRWQAADDKVIQWHDARTMHYERPLATTWQTSIEAPSSEARPLLDLLAWLAPAPLPRFLFDHGAAPAGTGDLLASAEDPRAILGALAGASENGPGINPEDALAELRELSLLQPAAETLFASDGQIHRVLALITRERQTGTARTAALGAALALVDTAAVGDSQDVRTWPVWEPLQPHLRVLVEAAEAAGIAQPTARLLNNLGLFLMIKAQHAEAEPLYRRALAIDEASFGPAHPEVARDLNNLAQLLQATNRLGEAEPLLRRALAIDEASFGREHPKVALRLNNLAVLLQATNRLGEAEPLMRRALAIDHAGFGAEHPDVARDLNNLAQLLKDTNRLGEAEPLMRRHLVIFLLFVRRTGHSHPHLGTAFGNYWSLLEALSLDEDEVRQRVRSLGGEAGLGEEEYRRVLDGL